jgi:hypothetical protein
MMKTFADVYTEDSDSADLKLGFTSRNGKLVVLGNYTSEDQNRQPVQMWAGMGVIDGGTATFSLGDVQLGKKGKIDIGTGIIVLDGTNALVTLGGNSGRGEGKIKLRNRLGSDVFNLDASTGAMSLGANGADGSLSLRTSAGKETVKIDGRHGNLDLGGNGADGDLKLKLGTGADVIVLDADNGLAAVGGSGKSGQVVVRASNGSDTIKIDGTSASITAGGNGAGGDIILKSSAGQTTFELDANNAALRIGGVGANGDVIVKNNLNVETITIAGSTGDIIFRNADFAEEFAVAAGVMDLAEPGTVMCLDRNGLIEPSFEAYSTKVIGVLAGAGGYKPALILDRQEGPGRFPVAMVGKVFCKASTCNGPIEPGDLLAASNIPGHAMKVTERNKALGAVIGKALGRLDQGESLIPVLVNLQ